MYQSASGFARSFKKKWANKPIGKTKGGFNPKIHMICTNENNPVIFSLSPGNKSLNFRSWHKVVYKSIPED